MMVVEIPKTIHGAMDNFEREENMLLGIVGSHQTVLVLFQSSVEEEQIKKDRSGCIQMLP